MKWIMFAIILSAGALWAARPLNTEDAFTIARGEIDLEIASDYSTAPGDCRQYAPGVVAYYGFEDAVYGALGLPFAVVQPAAPDAASGIGDVFFQTKFNLLGRSWGGLGALAQITFPTGDEERGLGTGTTAVGGLGAVTVNAGPAAIHGNIAYDYSFARGDVEASGCPSCALALEVPLWGPLGFGAEVFSELLRDEELDGLPAEAGGGLTFALGEKFVIDAGVHFGLGASSGEKSFTAGVTAVVWAPASAEE